MVFGDDLTADDQFGDSSLRATYDAACRAALPQSVYLVYADASKLSDDDDGAWLASRSSKA